MQYSDLLHCPSKLYIQWTRYFLASLYSTVDRNYIAKHSHVYLNYNPEVAILGILVFSGCFGLCLARFIIGRRFHWR